MEVNVEAELDAPDLLASCPLGYALSGMYRGSCDELHCLEKFHCCKVIPYAPTSAPTESPTDDVDECAAGIDDCDTNADCINLEGSYECKCHDGYSGDGVTCTDVNECDGANSCDANAQCANTEGSYECACNDGFSGDGYTCADINECESEGACDSNAVCTNLEGSYECACNAGYEGTGMECTDVNECDSAHSCDANAQCINTDGSYDCACLDGYKGDGYSCIEAWINEGESDWTTSFDNEGWSNAPNGAFITGLERSGRMGNNEDGIYHIEKITWIMSAWTDSCQDADWMHQWDNNDRWVYCPSGTALNGLYRSSSGEEGRLHNIEYGKCCTGVTQECFEHGVEAELDAPGLAKCPFGYAIHGMYRGSCDELHCLEKFSCCKVIGYQPTNMPTPEPTSACPEQLEDGSIVRAPTSGAIYLMSEGVARHIPSCSMCEDGIDYCAPDNWVVDDDCVETAYTHGEAFACEEECTVTEWMCVPYEGKTIVARMNGDEVECMEKPNPTKEGQCYWNAKCDENMRPTNPSDNWWSMQEMCEMRGNCANKCKGGWCKTVKDTFETDPFYGETCGEEGTRGGEEETVTTTITPTEPDVAEDISACVTEWRCVETDGRLLVARLNNENVECMERPGATKEGQCFWNPVCDDSGRPLTYVDKYWTMDQLCEIRGNCPARCLGGWCLGVKDAFAANPAYSQCASETDMFMLNGDCHVDGDCISSANYPNLYGPSESCMVTLKEDLYLIPGAEFDIHTDTLQIGDTAVTSTAHVPVTMSTGSSIIWESDATVNRLGWQICFSRDEPEVSTEFPNCVTEWRCVPRDDNIIVARLNNGNVECMGRPGKEGEGKCYWNARCDESARPTSPSDYYYTMDELCEIHGNCPAKCRGGWCLVVKETFMNDPNFSYCEE